MPNRLAHESSPYLLQHQNNPVDWYPWGPEAIEKARREDKPIFLSIGYSACHWCHVMEHESFENEAIARVLNENFVADQGRSRGAARPRSDLHERRADAHRPRRLADERVPHARPQAVLRRHVLAAAQLARHARLRPDPGRRDRRLEKPPRAGQHRRRPAHGRTAKCRRNRRRRRRRAQRRPDRRGRQPAATARSTTPTAASARRRNFRTRWTCNCCCASPTAPASRARSTWSASRSTAWPPAASTITSAAASPATRSTPTGSCRTSKRCSTTTRCSPARTSTPISSPRDENYARVVRETLDYIIRDMTDPAGGFYSTEDADSEGHEGLFYTWTPDEIDAVLGDERGSDVRPRLRRERRRQLRRPQHPQPAEDARAVREDPRPRAARTRSRAGREPRKAVRRPRKARPPRPRRQSHRRLERPHDRRHGPRRRRARRTRIRHHRRAKPPASSSARMRRDDGRLLHTWRHGNAKLDAYLDDYAVARQLRSSPSTKPPSTNAGSTKPPA